MDLLFIALGILLVWYVVDSYVHHGHSSEFKEFAKEQARNKARKEARIKEKAQAAADAAPSDADKPAPDSL